MMATATNQSNGQWKGSPVAVADDVNSAETCRRLVSGPTPDRGQVEVVGVRPSGRTPRREPGGESGLPSSDLLVSPVPEATGMPKGRRLRLTCWPGSPEGSRGPGGHSCHERSANPSREVSCNGAPVILRSHGAGSRGQHSSLPSDRVACPQKSFGSDLPCLPSGSLVLPHLQPSITVAEAKSLAGGSHPLLALLPRPGPPSSGGGDLT